MKPEQFIREYGVDLARKLIKAPNHATHANEDYQYFSNSLDREWCAYDDVSDVWVFENPNVRSIVKLSDLTKALYSIDVVNDFGGVTEFKKIIAKAKERQTYYTLAAYEEHLSTYESIYGGGDE